MIAFITGYPGFLGRRLVLKLLESKKFDKIIVLVEEKLKDYVKTLEESKNLEIYFGDIRKENFGIKGDFKNVTHLFHLAAIYDLAVSREPAYEINVKGTENVMEFAMKNKIERIIHVSTAYVSGTREGEIYEEELDMGQKFKNFYEETKFLAEKLVREKYNDLKPTVIRPGIVVGDSKTGETAKFDGPYFVMEALSRFPKWFPLPYIGEGKAKVNLVPVDYIIDGIFKISLTDKSIGKTYHLTDPNPKTAKELYYLFNKLLGRTNPVGKISTSVFKFMLKFPPLKGSVPVEALPYFECNAIYICKNAIEDIGWNVPDIKEYAPNIVRFFLEKRKEIKVGPWKAPQIKL